MVDLEPVWSAAAGEPSPEEVQQVVLVVARDLVAGEASRRRRSVRATSRGRGRSGRGDTAYRQQR